MKPSRNNIRFHFYCRFYYLDLGTSDGIAHIAYDFIVYRNSTYTKNYILLKFMTILKLWLCAVVMLNCARDEMWLLLNITAGEIK